LRSAFTVTTSRSSASTCPPTRRINVVLSERPRELKIGISTDASWSSMEAKTNPLGHNQ
jgi:hypothetical protein